jgi:hypothetical protein
MNITLRVNANPIPWATVPLGNRDPTAACQQEARELAKALNGDAWKLIEATCGEASWRIDNVSVVIPTKAERRAEEKEEAKQDNTEGIT